MPCELLCSQVMTYRQIKLFNVHECLYSSGLWYIAIDSTIPWKTPENAPNLTLLVFCYFSPSRINHCD